MENKNEQDRIVYSIQKLELRKYAPVICYTDQVLFYFTEKEFTESTEEEKKILVFILTRYRGFSYRI